MPMVLTERVGFVSVITINDPGRRNALSQEVVLGLEAAYRAFDASDARVAVLCGAGEHFSMGSAPELAVTELWRCMPGIGVPTEKPMIAAVSGECRGGAFTVAMFCDLCVATEAAAFAYPEGTHGAAGGLVASLACRIPHRAAMEIMLMSRPVSGRRAFEMGLVNEIAPPGAHVERAVEWAEVLASRAPQVLRLLKRMVGQTLPKGPAEIQAATLRDQTLVRTSEDSAEGKRAMAEGRPPVFRDR